MWRNLWDHEPWFFQVMLLYVSMHVLSWSFHQHIIHFIGSFLYIFSWWKSFFIGPKWGTFLFVNLNFMIHFPIHRKMDTRRTAVFFYTQNFSKYREWFSCFAIFDNHGRSRWYCTVIYKYIRSGDHWHFKNCSKLQFIIAFSRRCVYFLDVFQTSMFVHCTVT